MRSFFTLAFNLSRDQIGKKNHALPENYIRAAAAQDHEAMSYCTAIPYPLLRNKRMVRYTERG